MQSATIALVGKLLRDEVDKLEARTKRFEGYGMSKKEVHDVLIKKIVAERALDDFMEYVKKEKLKGVVFDEIKI